MRTNIVDSNKVYSNGIAGAYSIGAEELRTFQGSKKNEINENAIIGKSITSF